MSKDVCYAVNNGRHRWELKSKKTLDPNQPKRWMECIYCREVRDV